MRRLCCQGWNRSGKTASGNHFDVCILDLNLPETTGYDLVRRLLERQGVNRPLMVALTGFGRPEDFERAKTSGFDHHIVKPADIDKLRRLITDPDRSAR
jgi:CheY-like chemotaxis protein